MSEKPDKPSHKKKSDKTLEGRKYAVVSAQSVLILAESCGLVGLSEDLASKIGEDVTYRLRELIHSCSVHMRNNSERVLRSRDVAKVLPKASDMKIYGYISGGSCEFLHVPEAGVFVNKGDDVLIDLPELALSQDTISQKGDLFVSGCWYLPDNSPFKVPIIGVNSAFSSESSSAIVEPSLYSYFQTIARVILCKHGYTLDYVLKDLRTNPKITPVVPYFMNLLIEGLQELPKGSDACEHLLRMLHALTLNPTVYRDASVVISGLITALLTYAVDPTPFEMTTVTRDAELREMAGEGISKVLQLWYGSDQSMLRSIVQKMEIILFSPTSTQRSHYGSLVVLNNLGITALSQCLWARFEEYIKFLEQLPSNQETMELEACVLSATSHLYNYVFNSDQCVPADKFVTIDRLLYSHFGDALCAWWRVWIGYPINNELPRWSRISSRNFLNLLSEEVDVVSGSPQSKSVKNGSTLKTHDENNSLDKKQPWRGCGTLSQMFELHSLSKPRISFSSIKGIPTWGRNLHQRQLHQTLYTCPSDYFAKCSQLKHLGRMPSYRMQSLHKNFIGLFSNSL